MTTILVGTDDGVHVVGDPAASHLRGHAVGALARGRGAVWAITDARHLRRDIASGAGVPVASSDGLRLHCVAVTDAGILVGTSEAHLLRLDDGRLDRVEAFDRAEGRDGWYTPWGGPPDVRSIAASADGALYVNVHVGGILRSPDGGRTWTPTIDVDADVHQVLAHPTDPSRVLAATARGLAGSADGGTTWTFATEGLHATYCRAVALAGEVVLVSCSTGPRGGQASLYRRSLDSPGAFARCRGGLPEWFPANIDTACVGAVGAAVAFGTAGGEVFASSDAGATWERVAEQLPPVRCLLVLG